MIDRAFRRCASVLLAGVLASSACGRDEPVPSDASSSAAPATPPCGPAQLEDYRALLVGSCSEPQRFGTADLATPKWSEHEPLPADPLVVELDAVEVLIDGVSTPFHPVSFEETTFTTLEQKRADAGGERFAPSFVLAIRGDASMRTVEGVVRGLASAGATRGVLVYASSTLPRPTPPRYPEVYARTKAKLDGMEPADAAVFASRQIEPFGQRCEALAKTLGSVTPEPTDGRCERLMGRVAEDLVECGCDDDEHGELVSWLQLVAGATDVPVQANLVELVDDAPERVAATMTWAAFVAAHDAPMRTFWLELGP